MLNEEEIQAIRERLGGITDPPWRAKPLVKGAVEGVSGRLVASTFGHSSNIDWERTESENYANTNLIANAPTDIQALLKEREELLKALEEVRQSTEWSNATLMHWFKADPITEDRSPHFAAYLKAKAATQEGE